MKLVKFICLCLLLTSFIATSSGQSIPDNQNPDDLIDVFESLKLESNLFKIKSSFKENTTFREKLESATILSLDYSLLSKIYKNNKENLKIELPIEGENNLILLLENNNILADGFSVSTGGNRKEAVEYTPGNYYKGTIQGVEESVVALSIFKEEIIAVISTPERGDLTLGSLEKDKDTYVLYADNKVKSPPTFECGGMIEGDSEEHKISGSNAAAKSSQNCVNVYIEGDYDLYQERGSVSNSANYLTGLFNVVATLYNNEGITTKIRQIVIWSSQDPYPQNNSALSSFRSNNLSFNGDLAHLVTRDAGYGGVAYRPGLCNNYGYAYSNIHGSYSQLPTYSWSVEVFTHEMGHNLGSRHTHDCAWNGNNTAIDGCGYNAGYGGCPGTNPSGGGTIMSYCHLQSVGINLSNGFGQQPGDVIRNGVHNASCLGECNPISCVEFRIPSYGYNAGGWRVDRHSRMIADVNGDGRDDIIGFGNAGVYVSFSTAGGGYTAPSLKVGNFGYNAGGWRIDKHPRMMADVNGDGKADIVGFGNAGVYVSFSTGTGFTAPSLKVGNFGYNAGGWRVDKHPRMMADANGDGRADIIGFGNAGTYVSYSTGTGFTAPSLKVSTFGYSAGGWRVEKHPRMTADANGDGRADIIGFGNAGVYVSYSTGTGFSAPSLKVSTFGYSAGGWRVEKHPRMVADANGDGRADIIGFGNAGTYVSYSTGTGFTAPSLKISTFGYTAGGWRVDRHPRIMADMNGDGKADVLGFGNAGAYISFSTGTGFMAPSLKVNTFGYVAGGWRIDKHPRMTGDMNGNGKQEIVGFANTGVYTAKEDCSAYRMASPGVAAVELERKLESNELKISPNPVLNHATIQFKIDQADEVDLAIYNLQGQKIKDLIIRENLQEGTHSVDFEPNGGLAKGIYLIVLTTGNHRVTEKMMIR